jgi:hypothetical protein
MVQLPASMFDAAYAPAILAAVVAGDALVTWGTITSSIPGHTATFRVFSDALRVNGVRCGVSAFLAQQIADVLDCRLLTPKLADLTWQQRGVSLVPYPIVFTKADILKMATWAYMQKESALIDAAIAKVEAPSGIVSTVGKHWTLDNDLLAHPGKAQNYGWHFAGATFDGSAFEPAVTLPLRVIQGRGWAHPPTHVDASQTCVLVWRQCVVDGQAANLDEVLQSPTLSALVSHQGPLKLLRQPGTPAPALPPTPTPGIPLASSGSSAGSTPAASSQSSTGTAVATAVMGAAALAIAAVLAS